MNYQDALDFIQKGRNKKSRPTTGKASRIYLKDDDSIALIYHETDVVRWYKNGDIELDSGGWRTVTTKDRINTYVDNYSIGQDKGVWYVYKAGENLGVYNDHCIINNGSVKGLSPIPEKKKVNKELKAISGYCKDFIEALFKGEVDKPNGGDCWFCNLESEYGKGWGEQTGNDHIKEHIKEKYYVPSLLYRAVKRFPVSPIAESVLHRLWERNETPEGWTTDIAKEQIRKALYCYVKEQLNFAR